MLSCSAVLAHRLSLERVCIYQVELCFTMQLFTKILLVFAALSVVNAVPFDAEKRDGNYQSVAYYVDWVSR